MFFIFFFLLLSHLSIFFFFFFNDTATTEIYTLSLHDALPIFDRFHPAPHAATPHRARPCCVGGHHAARRRERARGWVGGEPQAEGSRGRRQLGPRDGGARPEPPAGPVGPGPVEALAPGHDDPRAPA